MQEYLLNAPRDDDLNNVDRVELNSLSSSDLLLARAVDNKTINNSKPNVEMLQQEENSVASSGSSEAITQQPRLGSKYDDCVLGCEIGCVIPLLNGVCLAACFAGCNLNKDST